MKIDKTCKQNVFVNKNSQDRLLEVPKQGPSSVKSAKILLEIILIKLFSFDVIVSYSNFVQIRPMWLKIAIYQIFYCKLENIVIRSFLCHSIQRKTIFWLVTTQKFALSSPLWIRNYINSFNLINIQEFVAFTELSVDYI